MFLNQLSYQEKKMFLDLCIHVANANSELVYEEKMMISEYCTEMNLPPIELYETEPFVTVADYFALADDKVKKIVVLEILGLAYCDGAYDDKELALVMSFIEKIGLSQETYEELNNAIIEYYKICKSLADKIK